MFFKLNYSDEVKNFEGLANICAQSSQYQGKEYPCANIDMQDRLISLVNAGIPDGKNELELKNNGFKSGRVYKLIQKEQQQLLNVVINEKGPKRGIKSKKVYSVYIKSIFLGRELRVLSTKKEIDHILYKALQPLKVGGKILGALRVWLLLDNDNWDVSQVRCNSVINLANKHVSWNPGKTDNDDVRLSDSANEEVKDPDGEDQETREQLYQDLDAEINDDQTSTVDIPEANNSSDSQEQYVSLVFIFLHYFTTVVIVKHRRIKRVYMLRTSLYGLRKRNGV
ncbi:unnamed protein product [Rotaria socialis]|uniref:Uncharacterized protein n=1 Tax=Rotaria socialis TaxID=392032 RepID=A0A818DLU6_9BILA|nr:unnamed protein product [Rotaria socialis]